MRRILLFVAFVVLMVIDLATLPLAVLTVLTAIGLGVVGHHWFLLPVGATTIVVAGVAVVVTVIVGRALYSP